MPTVYAAGTPNQDGYLQGIEVASSSALISQVRDIFQSAGKNVDDSNIGSNIITVEGDDSGDKYIIEWSVQAVSGNEKKLVAIGDLDGTGASKSEPVEIPFHETIGAKLYLSSDTAGGCIGVVNDGFVSQSMHFGFPYRTTDLPGSWYVGLLDVWQDSCQIAQDPDDNIWAYIHKYYNSSTESHTSPGDGGYDLLWDMLATAPLGNGSFSTYNATGNTNNLAYRAWQGAVDRVTGKPSLGIYGYKIGQLPYSSSYHVPGYNTAAEQAVPIHFPGRVRFARTGMASRETAAQDLVGSRIILSSGAKGEYQGFYIS